MSLDHHTDVNIEPAEGVQSWAQMLASVTSSVQMSGALVVSSSSEMDDTTSVEVLQDNGSWDKPPVISKVGKKAKVRKHAKKKKKTQTTQDEKKGAGTSKSKQKDSTVEQLKDSKLFSDIKSEVDSNTPLPPNKPDDKVEYQNQGEDVNKIKMRLEAQISARKGFGVVPSQEVIYDKVCYMYVLYLCCVTCLN